jgi:hypothetical protein
MEALARRPVVAATVLHEQTLESAQERLVVLIERAARHHHTSALDTPTPPRLPNYGCGWR